MLVADWERSGEVNRHRFVERISQTQKHMVELVKAMDRVAAVCRQRIQPMDLDLSEVVRGQASLLLGAFPDRRVSLAVEDDVRVLAERALIAEAIRHLLENAWKFTRREAVAEVEFGTVPPNDGMELEPPMVTCFIRDNGVGFDESLADKLYAPFQRLHAGAEFAGMGIGLSCVRRILHRLGGRTWAHGAPGQGATFYLALPATVA
jgi:signal transduction histidine kinase